MMTMMMMMMMKQQQTNISWFNMFQAWSSSITSLISESSQQRYERLAPFLSGENRDPKKQSHSPKLKARVELGLAPISLSPEPT